MAGALESVGIGGQIIFHHHLISCAYHIISYALSSLSSFSMDTLSFRMGTGMHALVTGNNWDTDGEYNGR